MAKKPTQVLNIGHFRNHLHSFQQMLQPSYSKTTFLSVLLLLLLHSLPLSFQPLCGYWMSLVCVWMSSLEKDVPQLHMVFHFTAWTETWTKHPDAFEQNGLDVRPRSRILEQFLKIYFSLPWFKCFIYFLIKWGKTKIAAVNCLKSGIHNNHKCMLTRSP